MTSPIATFTHRQYSGQFHITNVTKLMNNRGFQHTVVTVVRETKDGKQRDRYMSVYGPLEDITIQDLTAMLRNLVKIQDITGAMSLLGLYWMEPHEVDEINAAYEDEKPLLPYR